MIKRDILLPTMTALVISLMLVFLSECASNNNVDNGANGDAAAVGDEANGASKKGEINDDLKELTQNAGADTGATDAKPDAGAQAQNAPPPGDAGASNPDAEVLGIPQDGGGAGAGNPPADQANPDQTADAGKGQPPADAGTPDMGADQPPTGDLPPEAGNGQPPANPEAGAPTEDKKAEEQRPAETTTADAGGGDAMGVPTDEEIAKQKAQEQTSKEADQQTINELLKDEKGGRRRHGGGGTFSGHSRVPRIPAKALARGGALLNRFYFIRRGDKADTVSTLLYGTPAQARDLKKWNRGAWQPGKLIYYSSPSQPQDTQMRSFYQERSVQPEEYQVQKGDWISHIAAKRLGSPWSWKEIAVVNGLDSPDAVEVGQKLAIYPADLRNYGSDTARANGGDQGQGQQAQQAQNPPPVIARNNAPPPMGTPPGNSGITSPGDNTAPTQPDATPQQPPNMPDALASNPLMKKAKKSMGLDMGKLMEQNLPFIVLAGGVILLLILLLAVNKRRKARQSDDNFGDEGFSPKMRRR